MSINNNILNDDIIYQVISPKLIKFYQQQHNRTFYFKCNDSIFLPTFYLTSVDFQISGSFYINTLSLYTDNRGYLRDICPLDYDNIKLLLS